jgi:4-hydroxy-tetrahydrodipicolinate synthase
MNIKFRGLGVALVTPFNTKGEVDYHALEQLVDFQIDNGVDYLVAMGTTSEAATLTHEEQEKVLDAIVAKANKRVPIVVGCGGNNTAAVVEKAKQLSTISGIDALLSVVPYYNKPGQEGMYQHFSAIAQATGLPIILYNVPSRTSSFLNAETVLRLEKQHKNIVAVKEASGDFGHIMKLIDGKSEDFEVLSGDDATTLPGISIGMDGVISVIGNAYPKQFSELVHAALEGEFNKAKALQYNLLPVLDTLFVEGNPAGVKCHLYHLGKMENTVRLPLTTVSESLNSTIKEIVG